MRILYYILTLFEVILIIRIIVSWLNPDHGNVIIQWIYRLTEPVLEPVRRLLPAGMGGIDFSPVIIFIIIDLIKRIIY